MQDTHHETVLGRIHRIVQESPDLPALVDGTGTTTYGDLWATASAWAAALAPQANSGAVVGILHPRGVNVPTCHLATWLSGNAYLPLDPALPQGRLEAILRDARCPVVLTTEELSARVPSGVATVTGPVAGAPVISPREQPEDLAYVIYTSGTTGTPKGVEIEHRSVELLMRWYRPHFKLARGTRVSMLANLMFDGLVLDEWGALGAGATLAVPDQATVTVPQRIGAFLDEFEIEHAYLPTPMLERFLAINPTPRTLRSVATGGDRLRIWPAADFPAAVHNTYGPTEATVLVTSSRDLRTVTSRDGFADIGSAVDGAEVWLEDQTGVRIDEPGTPGELVIAGSFLARGYRHAPKLTAAAFEGGHYRTGDLCRWTPDGQLDFLGRHDTQVKLRGYRVELEEIEQVILAEPGVQQVAVIVTGEGSGQEVLAYLEGSCDADALRDQLTRILPDYMIPDKFTFVAALPATSSGKVDRVALRSTAGESGAWSA